MKCLWRQVEGGEGRGRNSYRGGDGGLLLVITEADDLLLEAAPVLPGGEGSPGVEELLDQLPGQGLLPCWSLLE